MISTPQFQLMKNSAYIINMGRGPVLDEDALAVALAQGEIAGAGLDVLSVEPPERSSPVPDGPGPLYTPHWRRHP